MAVLAVKVGVGARLAGFQAFLAIAILHFVANDEGFPVGMKTAFHI
jgi:hypothetical protein